MANERKKQANMKVLLTNLFMVVSVLAIAAALTLVAMGYRLEGGELTQYGLLQVSSVPSGAGVEIDGERVDTTEMSKMLPDGEHALAITKPGYDTWRGTVDVNSGVLSRVDWVRLFPVERQMEMVREYADMRVATMLPSRSGILVERQGATWTMLENVNGRTVSSRDIAVPEWAVDREIGVRRWNKDGDRMFVKIGEEWGVIDTRSAADSMNISQKFSLKFDDVMLIDDGGRRIYALENGNVRVVDLRNESVSGVKVSEVASISGSGDLVGYVQVVEGRQVVGVYKESESAGKTIFEPEGGEARVRAWQYWGEDVVTGVWDGELVVASGAAYGELTERARVDLGEAAAGAGVAASPTGRFVVSGGRVVDVTSGKAYEVRAGRWIDDYLMYEMREVGLVVWDFDGGNEREIGVASGGDVMISRENGWLYYAEAGGGKIVRERL